MAAGYPQGRPYPDQGRPYPDQGQYQAQGGAPQGDVGKPRMREWLLGIPLQVGTPTEYARGMKSWMVTILILQAIVCGMRFILLRDIFGGLWMALVIATGLLAYREGMNITYICCWGLACAINALFDLLGTVLPLSFGMVGFNFWATCAGVCSLLVYLIGASFAWHLYRDFALANAIPVKDFGTGCDPFGFMENTRHRGDRQPLVDERGGQYANEAGGGIERGQGAGQPGSGAAPYAGYGIAAAPYAGGAYPARSGYGAQAPAASDARLHDVGSNPFLTG
mmetsp:Transcript_21351/g.47250  ORF Transcript_21351/g.47250 Transcript_21351/m.47250 type:complete len:280 (-) Transcript_21351:127-966(-)|eukprot:CAMPEP_0170626348 /NCGR_PEP_ID=MMETSP0224-20130122/31309_1 /TAXON_ID=285029 /ORGANISM="Togula jolla, Strain CCCM 725" /LENGTH=279 /DNA_ID=CAMNT_0010953113 /DNA_START=189 /DNA_END=1028 /DNA_ORIENTATION=-